MNTGRLYPLVGPARELEPVELVDTRAAYLARLVDGEDGEALYAYQRARGVGPAVALVNVRWAARRRRERAA